MLTLKKLPWVSFALVLVTYFTLGWLLSAFHDPWLAWLMVVVGIFLLAASLSSPWSKIRDGFAFICKSDTRAFFAAFAAALLTVLCVSWLHIFVHALVVTSAGILFRLDAQTVGLSERQIFWILLILSLAGLWLGALAQTVI